MRILAIDTALGACAACIIEAEAQEPLAQETLVMERGHAEALLPLLDRLVSHVEGGFASLDRVAVTVGPGSYTGPAGRHFGRPRAIGLAAGVPVVGVTTLSALPRPARRRRQPAAPRRRDRRQARPDLFPGASRPAGRPSIAPCLVRLRDAVRLIGSGPASLAGSGAPAVAAEARAAGSTSPSARSRSASRHRLGGAARRSSPTRRRPCRSRSTCAGPTPSRRTGAIAAAMNGLLAWLSAAAARRLRIAPLDARHAARLAAIHARPSRGPGSALDFERLLAERQRPRRRAVPRPRREPAGFILSRRAADEAEILTVAIAAEARRGRGHAPARSSTTTSSTLSQAGVRAVHLEVEEGNAPALALYRRLGFREVGRRQGYYARPDGTRAAALTMSRASEAAAAPGTGRAGIPRAFPGEGLLAVKERGEQDARDRLSSFIGCQSSWRPARRFLTKVLRDLSAVGSPHRTLALPEVSAQARSDASGHLPIRFQPSRAAPP